MNSSCKDCGSRTRTLKPPGPRCATCRRKRKELVKKRAHERRVQKLYNLAPGEYEALKAFQDGRCYICRRATGATRELPLDHSHATGQPRGLLCNPCNRGVLGHLRDDPAALARAIDYLTDPPYRRMRQRDGLAP